MAIIRIDANQNNITYNKDGKVSQLDELDYLRSSGGGSFIQFGADGSDYSFYQTDTLIINGSPVAGTADQKVDAIEAIFAEDTGGGGTFDGTLDDIDEGTTNKHFTNTLKTKVDGIAASATANDTDANLKNRANHTGTQLAATISDFQAQVSSNTDVAAIKTIVGDGITDGDTVVNTLKEMLDTFQTYTEGVDIAIQLSGKQATLSSGSNIKTVGGSSVLGPGDIPIDLDTVLAEGGAIAADRVTNFADKKWTLEDILMILKTNTNFRIQLKSGNQGVIGYEIVYHNGTTVAARWEVDFGTGAVRYWASTGGYFHTFQTDNIDRLTIGRYGQIKFHPMNAAARDAIVNAAAGDTVYNSTVGKHQFHNGTTWDNIGGITQIIDVAGKYGVVADGSTDNATALLAMRTDLAGANKPHYHLHFPTGEIRYSNNKWLFGIEKFTIHGHGATFRSTYNSTDVYLQRPFLNLGIWATNTMAYSGTITYTTNHLINTVSAGSKTITTTTAGDAAGYTAGKRLLIWAYDQTGNGYPPGVRFAEWHEVESVNAGTGVITLKRPIENNYSSSIWDVPDLLGTGDSGKPRITLLDRADMVYCRYAEFNDLTFGNNTDDDAGSGSAYWPADEVVINRCRVEGFLWPSENRIARYDDIFVEDIVEYDKIVGKVYAKNIRTVNKTDGGSGCESVYFTDCQFSESIGLSSRLIDIRNSSLRGNSIPDIFTSTLNYQAGQNPVRTITIENLTFSSGPSMNATTEHINVAPYTSLTIAAVSGTNIIVPFVSFTDANTAAKVYRIEAGVTRMFKSDGTKGGLVTSVTFDATYNSNQGAFVIAGTWTAPVAAEVWRWSPVSSVIDLGGHRKLDTRPLWNSTSLRWKGNRTTRGQIHTLKLNEHDLNFANGGTGIRFDFYAKIIDIEVIVGKPWTGSDGSLRFDLLDTSSNNLIRVNTLTSGRRFVSKYFAHGSVTGDLVTSTESARFETWYQQLDLTLWTTGFVAPTDQSIAARPELDITIRWSEF